MNNNNNNNNNNNRFASQLNPRPKCSSARSHQPATEPHPEPGKTNPRPPTTFLSRSTFHLPVRTESVAILSILCALGLSEAVASFWVSRPNFLLSQRNEDLTKDKRNITAQYQNNHKQNHFLTWQGYWRERVWGTSQLNGPATFPIQSTVILIIQSISIATTTTTDCIISQTEPITALCMTGNNIDQTQGGVSVLYGMHMDTGRFVGYAHSLEPALHSSVSLRFFKRLFCISNIKQAIPVHAWRSTEGSRRVTLPDFQAIGIWR